MSTLKWVASLAWGFCLVPGCAGNLINDVGDINAAGAPGGSTSSRQGGGSSNGGVPGSAGTTVLLASGGAMGDGGTVNTDGPLSPGGRTATGGVLEPVGGAPNGGTPNGGVGGSVQSIDGVILLAAWKEIMSGVGHREFRAAIYNGSDRSIFVDTSCIATWRRKGEAAWTSVLDGFGCTNSIAGTSELPPGGTAYSLRGYNLEAAGAGIYRLQGEYWIGCTLAGTCDSRVEATSAEVWVLSSAATAPTNQPVVGPYGLHAVCSETAPCPSGQTAIETYYQDGIRCTCEMPCEPEVDECPPATSCTFVSAILGSLCK